jgi:uncharacterized membrane protein YbhN (UPF0104 family)
VGISTVLSLGVGVFLLSRSGIEPKQVIKTIENLGWGTALLAVAFNLVQTVCVLLRHSILIPEELHPGWRRVFYSVISGHALNTVFPARAGDVLKCFLLSKGRKNRLKFFASAGVIVADRLVDVAVLLGMAAIWKAYRHPRVEEWVVQSSQSASRMLTAAFLGIALLIALFYVVRRVSAAQRKWSKEFRKGFLCLGRPRPLLFAIILAAGGWSGEIFSILVLSGSQGVELSFAQGIFVILALNIAISFPVSVANLGPFEAAIALSLVSFGMDSSQAFAVATVHHGLQLAAIGLTLLISLTVRPRL